MRLVRPTRYFLPSLLLLLSLIARPAAAQERTVFDFSAPAAGQRGDYEASAGAEVAEGQGRLAARDGWAERAQPTRAAIDVSNAGIETPRAVLSVPVDGLPAALRRALGVDGTDATAWLPDGTRLDRPVAAGISSPSALGVFHVRVPTLPAGASSIVLYAGDRSGAAAVDELAFFTDPTPVVRTFVTGAYLATNATVVSLVASNDVILDGAADFFGGALESRNRAAGALGTENVSAGPIAATWLGAGGDAFPPESFAGQAFVIPAPRYDEALFVVAPFGEATLTFGQPGLSPQVVAAGSARRITTLVADGASVHFTSDAPVVVVRGSDSGDITPMPPAATRLIGVGSGSVRVAAGASPASLTYYLSSGATQTATVPANGELTLTGGAAQGTGDAFRIVSDTPIGAITYGDGDGGEAVAFLPPTLLGRELVVPFGAQFVAIASALPNTTCRVLAADGTELASGRTSAFAPPVPGKLFFGSATNGLRIAGPAALRCDAAVWALAEDASSETEKLLIASVAHRPHPGGEVSFSAGAAETRFDAGSAWVRTPGFAPSRPMVGVASLEPVDVVGGVGATVRYQVSVDGGATWSVPAGAALREATEGEGAAAADFAGVSFPETDALQVRVLLSTDGVDDAAVDELAVEAILVAPPAGFAFDGIASPQRVGVAHDVTVRLVDAAGATVRVDGEVEIGSDPASVYPGTTGALVDGVATLSVTPEAGASMVFLVARMGDALVGSSAPFEVVAASSTRTLTVVDGDGQTGAPGAPLDAPVAVRLTDPEGAPVVGERVTVRVVGGGAVSPEEGETDDDGRLSVTWTLGASGDQQLRFALAEDDAVTVVATARFAEAGGGCDCAAAPGRRAPLGGLGLLALLCLALLSRTRDRSRGRAAPAEAETPPARDAG